jgi:hypothetical protein
MSQNFDQKKFADLYQKFEAGKQWLDAKILAGVDVAALTDSWIEKVVIPIRDLYMAGDSGTRAQCDAVMLAYDTLGGKALKFKAGVR